MANVHIIMTDDNGVIIAETSTDRPQAQLLQIINYFAASQKYQATIPDPNWVFDPDNPTDQPMIPNPETKGAFLIRKIKEYAAGVVLSYAATAAADAARAQVLATPITF